jgi:hypothetical protein
VIDSRKPTLRYKSSFDERLGDSRKLFRFSDSTGTERTLSFSWVASAIVASKLIALAVTRMRFFLS